MGNVDAGKSTLLGVLTHGELDNGRGTARMKLFRHKHEMETGRTSSVGNDILGFDSQGKCALIFSTYLCIWKNMYYMDFSMSVHVGYVYIFVLGRYTIHRVQKVLLLN